MRTLSLRQGLWILLGLAVAATGGFALWKWRQGAATPSTREVAVARGDIEVSIQTTGTVRPRNRIEIKPPVAGRAEEVRVQEGQAVRKGQILAWMSSNERAALLDAARAQGEAEVKRWAELYRPTAVVAPIDGTVILRAVEPGQSFATTDSLLVVADRLIVEAQVDETDIAQVHLGQYATIVLDAYPGESISAKVSAIAFESKTVSNVTTYTVDVLPQSVPSFMRSGMTTNVAFRVALKVGVLRVPSRALKMRDGRTYVDAVADGGREERQVQTGLTDGKYTEVVEGLAENERVLLAQIKADKRATGSNPFSSYGRPPSSKK